MIMVHDFPNKEASILVSGGKNMSYGYLNERLSRLVENDEFLYGLKHHIETNNVVSVGNQFPDIINLETSSCILHRNENLGHSELIFPFVSGLSDTKPIPKNLSKNAITAFSIQDESSITSMVDVLSAEYVYYTSNEISGSTSLSGNILPYNATIYALSAGKVSSISGVYKYGTMTVDEYSMRYVSSFSEKVKYPILDFTSAHHGAEIIETHSNEDTFGFVTETIGNQYSINNSHEKLMDIYESGHWTRKIGNSLILQGGLEKIEPPDEISDLGSYEKSISFSVPLSTINNITVAPYFNEEVSSIPETAKTTMPTLPVYIKESSITGFTLGLEKNLAESPEDEKKTYGKFNILWSATGLAGEIPEDEEEAENNNE